MTEQLTRELLAELDDYAIFAPVTPVLRGIAQDTASRSPVGLFGGGLPEALESLSPAQTKGMGLGSQVKASKPPCT
ncbi:MAG: hypothetical protein HYV07_23305 [Deltaproteobacteria bacterium]|nr:hypothetical protein [Deltaproteobacteria bacterium]